MESLGRRLQSKATLSNYEIPCALADDDHEVIRESSEEAFALHSRGLRFLVVRA